MISFDIPNRSVRVELSDEELEARRQDQEAAGWQPAAREREVSPALKIFARFAQSADKGAVRLVP